LIGEMSEDKFGKNVEATESRLVFLWQVCMGASLVYLLIFCSVHWNSEVRSIQEHLDDLHRQTASTVVLRKYEDVYLYAGARALQFKLSIDKPVPSDANCGGAIGKGTNPHDFPNILKKCSTWTLFSGLLMDEDSVANHPLEGGGTRKVYDVPNTWKRLDQDENTILSLPQTTGLSEVPGWEKNVVDSIETLSKNQSEKEQDLIHTLVTLENVKATGQFQIPVLDKSINPVAAFWIGGLLFFITGYLLYATVKDRAAIISEWSKLSNDTLTWENAISRYVIRLPWLLPSERIFRDKISGVLAKCLPFFAAGSVICIVVYCAQFPNSISPLVRYFVASLNILLGGIGVWSLFRAWKALN